MTIYRVVTKTPFADGHVHGDLICPGDYSHKSLMGLLNNGKIAPVSAPPLIVVPGWQTVAEKVMDIGIVDAVEFIEADTVQIMEAVGWKRKATVARWKDKAFGLLTTSQPLPRPRHRGG